MIYIMPGTVDQNKPSALYENIFKDGVLSGLAANNLPLSNALTGTTWEYWRPQGAGRSNFTVNLTTQTSADCLFIDAHSMATDGSEFRLEVSSDGGTTWDVLFEFIKPDSDRAIMVLFPERIGNAWRMGRQGGIESVGVIMLGNRLVFPNGIDQRYTSFQHGQTIEVMGGNSLGGQFLGQKIMRKGGKSGITFPLLDAEWVDTVMSPFEEHYNYGKPFAFAANPAFRVNDLAYCWRPERESELRPSYYENGLYEDFTMGVDFFNG